MFFFKTILKAGLIKVVGIGLAFVFLLVVAQYSSDIEYGVFATIFSAATILGFAFVAGQHVIIMRYWPSFDENETVEKADAALRWSFQVVIGACLAGSVILLSGAYVYMAVDATPPLWIKHVWPLLAMTLAFALSEFGQGALRAKGEVLISLSGREVLWRLLSIGTIFVTGQMSGEAFIYLVATTLAVINALQLWLIFRKISHPMALPKQDQRDMRKRSGWIWLGTTVGPLVSHSGTIIVALALGPVAAGTYFAADRLAKLLSIALIAVNQVLGPQLAREFHAGRTDKVQQLMTMSSIMAGAIAIVGVIVFLIGGKFALTLFSDSYTSAYPVLIILALGQVVNSLCGPNTMLMNMAGLERSNTIIMSITGVFSLVIIFFGAAFFGIVGAAIAAATTMAVWNGCVVLKCYRVLKILPIKLGKPT
jgi:O-antigen/teichoic acid export membrane protein